MDLRLVMLHPSHLLHLFTIALALSFWDDCLSGKLLRTPLPTLAPTHTKQLTADDYSGCPSTSLPKLSKLRPVPFWFCNVEPPLE